MKKALFTLLLAGVISFSASAQTPVRIGGLLGYGSEIENIALGAIAEFMIKENMGISPSLVFYFPKKENGLKYSLWELNGNFNYYFITEGSAHVYGLAGLNIAGYKAKYESDFFDDYSSSDTEVGLNLGGGVNFVTKNDKLLPFAELKYVISDFDQLCIFAGIKFIIN
jgi:outer membrane protein X